jgi:hypothetical protein
VAEGKAPIPEWSKDTFTASYFNDGDIHTYGAVAQIEYLHTPLLFLSTHARTHAR